MPSRVAAALVLLACLAAGVFPGAASAGLLPPQQVDARTGAPPVQLGAAIGATDAWVGFMQQAGGIDRLYAAYARGGVFGSAVPVDRGNEVTFGALVGSRGSGALAVFEEKVDGKGVLFARRLSPGAAGAAVQVSAPATDAELGRGGNVPFDRGHSVAMNESGAAVLCFTDKTDPNAPKAVAAVLAAGATEWSLHAVAAGCADPGIDGRGNAAVLGQTGDTVVVTRIVGGQLDEDPTEDNAMDQWTLEVSPGGQAMVQGRDDDFHVNAHYKGDIALDGDWQRTARLEEGVIQANAAPEDPFAALDSGGNGLLLFRDNKMDAEQGYYRGVAGGTIGAGGVLSQSPSRQRSAVDEHGHVFVAYTDEAAARGVVHRFDGGAPGPALPLAPDLGANVGPNLLGISANAAGDLLALVTEHDANFEPTALHAVFGDFVAPAVRPAASKRRRARRPFRLRSRAFDALGLMEVSWRLPRGVAGKRTRSGATIVVRFRRAGRYRATVTATDRGGNVTTKKLRFRVAPPRRPRG